MADLADELAASLDDPGPVPSNGAELVRFAGGRRALTEQLSGMSGPPRRSAYSDQAGYKAASTRWRSASRRAQRWDEEGKAGKQRRGTSRATLAPEQRERVRGAAVDRKWATLYARGGRMRLIATVKVPTPTPGRRAEPARRREMPAGGGGVYISADELDPVLTALAQGDAGLAAFELLAAFGDAYGFEALEVEDVERVKLWPEGTREPE